MALIDFILNFAALVLWLNWLPNRFDPTIKTSAASLAGTLRKAGPVRSRRWLCLASLLLLLLVRAFAYWEICAQLHATPTLDLGIVNLSFRSEALVRMLLFSALGFVLILAEFYFWMLLLSVANFRVPDNDPFQRLVRAQVRWFEGWPRIVRLLVPFAVGAVAWLALHPLLVSMRIIPQSKFASLLFEQATLMGLMAWFSWKYLVVGLLFLHLVNSYVYLGNHPFWNYLNLTARNFLRPFEWLPVRFGKVDFLPVVVIALVLLACEGGMRLLRMPF